MAVEYYPRFYKHNKDIVAILTKDRAFHLKMNGHGKGNGFEFVIYVTRRMVLKYGHGHEIKYEDFQKEISAVFFKYLNEINMLLPKGFLESKNNNLRLH